MAENEVVVPEETGLAERLPHGPDDILKAHFRNGLERFAIDGFRLESEKKRWEELQRRDAEDYQKAVAVGKAAFRQNTGFLKRWFGDKKYIPPPEEPSLETTVYASVVEVGSTLSGYLDGLRQFSSLFQNIGRQYQELSRKEEALQLEAARLEQRLAAYPQEAQATTELLERLEAYSTLLSEEQKQLQTEVHTQYFPDSEIPLGNAEIRAALCQRLKEEIFALGQCQENDCTDLEVAQIEQESLAVQMGDLKKDAERFWLLYNPARIEAARLKAAYDQLSSAAERGTVIYAVSGTCKDAQALCERARESQQLLEAAIETNMELNQIHRQLTGTMEDGSLAVEIQRAYQLAEEK